MRRYMLVTCLLCFAVIAGVGLLWWLIMFAGWQLVRAVVR